MAIKTVAASGGGDYTTFTAAIAGASGGDTIDCIEAGTYVEPGALVISKILTFTNSSGGTVTINQALGTNNGQISGGVTVTWTGDFVHEIRKPGSGGIEYNWLISGSGSDLVLDGVTLKSDYTTGNTQAIYQQAGNSHHLTNCTITGQYETVVHLATTCVDSVIDGLTITDSLEYVIYTTASPAALFDTFDMRRVVGVVSRAPISAGSVSVTTSGLMGACVFWGMNDPGSMILGTGAISIEKCTFDGTKAYPLSATGGSSTGVTVRNCEFCGFSGEGVYVFGPALAGLVDYCGAANGCPAISNSAGSVGANCQTSDPLFTDYAAHDYRLLATSPRINAGTAVTITVDPDGVTIPQGSAPDIGGYEWISSVSPVTYESEEQADSTLIATDLQGNVIEGFQPFELFAPSTDPQVTLAQVVLISLFSDRVAHYDDDLPAGQDDRRGWFADTATEKFGSRLWLQVGASVDDDTLDIHRHYVEEALSHLTRDGLATSVSVEMEIIESDINPAELLLVAEITVRLDERRGVILKFPDLWGL